MARTPPLTKKPRSPGEFPGEESRTHPHPHPPIPLTPHHTWADQEEALIAQEKRVLSRKNLGPADSPEGKARREKGDKGNVVRN